MCFPVISCRLPSCRKCLRTNDKVTRQHTISDAVLVQVDAGKWRQSVIGPTGSFSNYKYICPVKLSFVLSLISTLGNIFKNTGSYRGYGSTGHACPHPVSGRSLETLETLETLEKNNGSTTWRSSWVKTAKTTYQARITIVSPRQNITKQTKKASKRQRLNNHSQLAASYSRMLSYKYSVLAAAANPPGFFPAFSFAADVVRLLRPGAAPVKLAGHPWAAVVGRCFCVLLERF